MKGTCSSPPWSLPFHDSHTNHNCQEDVFFRRELAAATSTREPIPPTSHSSILFMAKINFILRLHLIQTKENTGLIMLQLLAPAALISSSIIQPRRAQCLWSSWNLDLNHLLQILLHLNFNPSFNESIFCSRPTHQSPGLQSEDIDRQVHPGGRTL